MGDVTLSSAVRANLSSLQSTAEMMSSVQNKLATGKKVNSALDNPNSFFTASGLTSRANDLSTLLDDMGQSVQTLKAADEGISSITKLVESAKAKANQALQTQSQYERKQFTAQYNELLTQIEDLAKDSGYKGKNLLSGDGNDLTTIFNEDSTSKLKIEAVDYTDASLSTGLNLSDLAEGEGSATSFQLEGGKNTFTLTDADGQALNSSSLLASASGISTTNTLTLNEGTTTAVITGSTLAVTAGTTVQDLLDTIESVPGVRAEFDEGTGQVTVYSNDDIALQNDVSTTAQLVSVNATAFATTSDSLINSGSFETGDTLTLTDGNGYELGSFEIEEDSSVDDLVNFINDFQGVSAEFNTSTGKIALESETDLALTSDNSNFNADSYTADSDGVTISALSDSGFATDSAIDRTVDRLNTALSTLRTQASEFGTNLSIVENRQDFTKSMINTLEEGAGKLTLADTNEEGANLLALQTRQSLASTSLSFAAQADQNVLRLF
ncbi:flagellin N-terminal helical domain-containing protein [Roseibium marinum]|uniref:Flagellin n=1 Tax=Roseibium marinum TaxID=281252 RepID=A0A2S3UKE8_9HYPH|nr:flagellin [Roseibium marinum]POF28184.1 flagellin-like hook-associated protein FlgL [Roseibium marinum]